MISKPEMVQLQALTLATKLLALSSAGSSSSSVEPPQTSLSPALSPTQTVHLLTQYLFSQAAIASTSYDVRDRARSLGALIRGISPEVYRASVSTYASDQLYEDTAKTTAGNGGDNDDDDVEVTAEEWDRQVRALRSTTTKTTSEDLEDETVDDIGAGGVTLRVEQARLVLFEGKIVSSSPSLNGGLSVFNLNLQSFINARPSSRL